MNRHHTLTLIAAVALVLVLVPMMASSVALASLPTANTGSPLKKQIRALKAQVKGRQIEVAHGHITRWAWTESEGREDRRA